MKKTILIGSLLTVFVLMMMPSISAVESDSFDERTKLRELLEQRLSFIQEAQENFDDEPPQPTIFLRMLLWIKNLILLLVTAPVWVTILLKLLNLSG